MATQVNRDPFARSTLMREKVDNPNTSCAWCGQKAKWFYYWESDSSSNAFRARYGHCKPFCSISCYRDYQS